jgi:hypothetical protein
MFCALRERSGSVPVVVGIFFVDKEKEALQAFAGAKAG